MMNFLKQKIKIVIAISIIIISIIAICIESNTEISTIEEEKTAFSAVKENVIKKEKTNNNLQNIIVPSNGVKIEYVDINTDKNIASSENISGIVDEIYNASNIQKELLGYTFVETYGELEGTLKKEQVNVKYKYAKNITITIKYIDKQTGKELINSKEIEGYEGKIINVEKVKIKGYTCETNIDSIKLNSEIDTISLMYNKIGNIATSNADKNTNNKINEDEQKTIRLKYVDIDTDKVIYEEKIEITEGNKIKVKIKEIEGYKLIEDSNNKEDSIIDEIIKSLGSDLESNIDSESGLTLDEKANVKSQYEIVMNCDDSDYIIYYKKV